MEKEISIPTAILTLHNVYGPPCDFSEERSQVIPSLIRKAMNCPDEPFVVWGSGSQGRAFVHVDSNSRYVVADFTSPWQEPEVKQAPLLRGPRWSRPKSQVDSLTSMKCQLRGEDVLRSRRGHRISRIDMRISS